MDIWPSQCISLKCQLWVDCEYPESGTALVVMPKNVKQEKIMNHFSFRAVKADIFSLYVIILHYWSQHSCRYLHVLNRHIRVNTTVADNVMSSYTVVIYHHIQLKILSIFPIFPYGRSFSSVCQFIFIPIRLNKKPSNRPLQPTDLRLQAKFPIIIMGLFNINWLCQHSSLYIKRNNCMPISIQE